MKKTVLLIVAVFVWVAAVAQGNGMRSHVIGFYNLENLFDTVDDPAHNDEEYLPEGGNKWTEVKYAKKIRNMAKVIRAIRNDNGVYHSVLGVCEIENRRVLEDLVSDPQIADANFQIVHYDGPDRRGVDVGLLYRPGRFTLLDSESIPFKFEGTKVAITLDEKAQENFRTRDILMVHGLIEGEHFAFYVTHLPSRVGGKGGDLRCLGAEIIYKHSREMEARYPGIKIVVMGDMNDNPTDDSQTVWLHGRETIDEMEPADFPVIQPNRILLDTGACYGGPLSCVDVLSGRVWQSG